MNRLFHLLVLLVLWICLPPVSADGQDGKKKSDGELLVGKWRVTSAIYNSVEIFGEPGFLKEKYLRKTTFTFDKEQVVVSVEGLDVEQKAKYRLGPKKNPKTNK